MDHSEDDQVLAGLAGLADGVTRADLSWDRRWRLGQALMMPARAPSWTALAASGGLLVVAAALLVVSVTTGHRWLLLLVVTIFAVGMGPVARSTRGHRSSTMRAHGTGCDRRNERP